MNGRVAVDCGAGGRLQHVRAGMERRMLLCRPRLCPLGRLCRVSALHEIRSRGGEGLVLGKQRPCFVGAGELLREALALQCGDPLLCSRCCVSVLACRAPRAWASCLQPAARVVLSPRHLGGRRVCVLPAAADGTGCLEGRIAIRYTIRYGGFQEPHGLHSEH